MIFSRLIDSNGNFLEDVFCSYNDDGTAMLSDGRIVEQSEIVGTPCPSGFYLPHWDGVEWIEGKTAEEIAAIRAAATIEKTDSERISDLETLVLELGGII